MRVNHNVISSSIFLNLTLPFTPSGAPFIQINPSIHIIQRVSYQVENYNSKKNITQPNLCILTIFFVILRLYLKTNLIF